MTREELQETYSKLSTQELLQIVDRKFDYTETAVTVAFEEISKRNISEDDIKNYKTEQIEKVEKLIRYNIIDDLSLFQKNLFFFIWLPVINGAVRQNFRDDGYVLKLKQASYYSWLGFIFFMLIGAISGIYNLPGLTALGLWILTFLPAYGFDEKFNRQKQIERLRRLFDKYNNEEKASIEEHSLNQN